MSIVERSEPVTELAAFGIQAFTTTRASGTFGTNATDPVREVMGRWAELRRELRAASGSRQFATATQVHGTTVLVHHRAWEGWLRADDADGHCAVERGIAVAVTVADCVPVFLAHPSGAITLLHSGWRGTAGRIVEHGIAALEHRGFPAAELRLHTGPAICGRCYEVSGEVYEQLLGTNPGKPTTIDLRAIIADHARAAGVRHITSSGSCTRCDNDRFYSHRAGDAGRQVAVMVAT